MRTGRTTKMTMTRESWILMGICLLDLASTLFLLNTKAAMEGNPLMSFYLGYGVGTFVLIKLTLMLLPIFIAEWSRQYRPQFVRLMLRAAIVTYVGAYVAVFLTTNVPALADRMAEAPPAETHQSQSME